MEFQLVFQWPAATEADYEVLLAIENSLESALSSDLGCVDGHDFGSGEMNLFVHTDVPLDAFRCIQAAFGGSPHWTAVRAAYRRIDRSEYKVIWPSTLRDFSIS